MSEDAEILVAFVEEDDDAFCRLEATGDEDGDVWIERGCGERKADLAETELEKAVGNDLANGTWGC